MTAIVSNFNNTNEGWDTVGGSTPLENPTSGGVFGGYISASDDLGGVLWYFEGGAKWTGDLSLQYGGTISYGIRQKNCDWNHRRRRYANCWRKWCDADVFFCRKPDDGLEHL
jgi:hypothetical protein